MAPRPVQRRANRHGVRSAARSRRAAPQGDRSEATTIALALAYGAEGQVLDNRNDAGGPAASERAAALLRPFATAPDASLAARRAYVETLVRIGFEQASAQNNEGATDDLRHAGEISTWLAMSLARLGRATVAAQPIAPVVKLQRDLASKNRGDGWLPLELACAPYVESLTDSKNGATSLREAVELVRGLPPDPRSVRDAEEWRERIRQTQLPRPGST